MWYQVVPREDEITEEGILTKKKKKFQFRFLRPDCFIKKKANYFTLFRRGERVFNRKI